MNTLEGTSTGNQYLAVCSQTKKSYNKIKEMERNKEKYSVLMDLQRAVPASLNYCSARYSVWIESTARRNCHSNVHLMSMPELVRAWRHN